MRKIKKEFVIDLIVKVWPTGNSSIAPGTTSSLLSAVIGYTINLSLGSELPFYLAL